MYCIDTEALVFMFNGGSHCGFTKHTCINNEKHVHHGFLTPRPYLCSTSLKEKMAQPFSKMASGWSHFGSTFFSVYIVCHANHASIPLAVIRISPIFPRFPSTLVPFLQIRNHISTYFMINDV